MKGRAARHLSIQIWCRNGGLREPCAGRAPASWIRKPMEGSLNLQSPFEKTLRRLPIRVSAARGTGRYAPRDDAARTDDAVIADRHAGAHDDVRAEPAVIADGYGLGVAQKARFAVLADHAAALAAQHGVHRRDDRDVRPEVAMVADGHARVVLHGEVEVHKAALAHAGVAAVVKVNRPEHPCALADAVQQLMQHAAALLRLILIEAVVILAEPVRLFLLFNQLGHIRGEKLSVENAFLFRYGLSFRFLPPKPPLQRP